MAARISRLTTEMAAYFTVVFLICCLFAAGSGSPVQVTASPASVAAGFTTSLAINCSFNQQNSTAVVTQLVLAKSTANSAATEIADLSATSPHSLHVKDDLGANVSGRLNPNGISYILYQWSSSPPESLQGQYQCTALGLDILGHPVQQTATTTIDTSVSMEMVVNKLNAMENYQSLLQSQLNSTKEELSVATSHIINITDKCNAQNTELASMKGQINTVQYILNSTALDLQKRVERSESALESMKTQIMRLTSAACCGTDNPTLLAAQKYLASWERYINSSFIGREQTPYGSTFLLSKSLTLDVDRYKMHCEMMGGYLAELTNQDKYNLAVDFLNRTMVSPKRRTVIAGTDVGTEGHWRYSRSGKQLNFTTWKHGFPRNSTKYNCLDISTDHMNQDVHMIDTSCRGSSVLNFLCEIPN